MDIAWGELGVKEVPGAGDNPRIVAYHAATRGGPSPDEVPWCSSFVNWAMQEAGVPRTGSKAARSWLQWGRGLATPEVGCVVVLRRGAASWQGHVGLVVRIVSPTFLDVLGGNQGNAVTVQRFPVSRVLGYRTYP